MAPLFYPPLSPLFPPRLGRSRGGSSFAPRESRGGQPGRMTRVSDFRSRPSSAWPPSPRLAHGASMKALRACGSCRPLRAGLLSGGVARGFGGEARERGESKRSPVRVSRRDPGISPPASFSLRASGLQKLESGLSPRSRRPRARPFHFPESPTGIDASPPPPRPAPLPRPGHAAPRGAEADAMSATCTLPPQIPPCPLLILLLLLLLYAFALRSSRAARSDGVPATPGPPERPALPPRRCSRCSSSPEAHPSPR